MDKYLVKRKKNGTDDGNDDHAEIPNGKTAKKIRVGQLPSNIPVNHNPFAIKGKVLLSSTSSVSNPHIQSTRMILQKLDPNVEMGVARPRMRIKSPIGLIQTSPQLDFGIQMANSQHGSLDHSEQASATGNSDSTEEVDYPQPISSERNISCCSDEEAIGCNQGLEAISGELGVIPEVIRSAELHSPPDQAMPTVKDAVSSNDGSGDALSAHITQYLSQGRPRREESFRSVGKYVSAPIDFIRDPVAYSHPLTAFSSDLSTLVSSKFRASDAQVLLSTITIGGQENARCLAPKRVGCTCIKFDTMGVLFVVGGSDGVIRLYDFDDFLFASQKSTKMSVSAPPPLIFPSNISGATVAPIRTPLHTGRDISDVVWLPRDGYGAAEMTEIAVAFTYHSEVYVYDLRLPMDEQVPVVLDLKGVTGRGNASLLARSKSPAGVVSVFAGGTYGQVRMWTLHQHIRSGGDPVSPTWEVSGDHLSRPGPHSAVVGLQTVRSRSDWVLSITRMGVVALWDTSDVSTASFSSVNSPACILRVCIWDSALPASPRPGGRVREDELIAPPAKAMVVGVSCPHGPAPSHEEDMSKSIDFTESCVGDKQSEQSRADRAKRTLRSLCDSLICVTLSTGEICVFDYITGKFVSQVVSSGKAGALTDGHRELPRNGDMPNMSSSAVSYEHTVENILPKGRHHDDQHGESVSLAGSALSTRDVRCPAVFCKASGPNICISGCSISAVDVLRLGVPDRKAIDRHFLSSSVHTAPMSSTYCFQGTPETQWTSWLQERNRLAPALQRTPSISHTLPGHLLEASPGNYTIVASHDMSPYLCPISAMVTTPFGGVDMEQHNASNNIFETSSERPVTSSSSNRKTLPGSRSGVVCLDWSVPSVGLLIAGGPWPLNAPSAECWSGWGGLKKTCTLTRVAGQKLTLDSPYMGPPVRNGQPRVYLRTNLTASVPPPTSSLPVGASTSCCPVGMPGQVLSRIPLSQPATALEAHPFLPYVVIGCWDDSITVISPHGLHDLRER